MSDREPSCSIVVVNYESAAYLRVLVASMNAHLAGTEELIVVDNGSAEQPGEAVREWKGRGRLLALGRNAGFGAASNVGVAEADGPISVLLNPDTELLGGLTGLVAAAAELRGLVGPRVLEADGSLQPSASGPEVGIWPWVRALLPGRMAPGFVRARTEPYRLDRRVRVCWLTGACIAAPTEVLRELGPFDEALHMYGEDIDLGLRAAASGVGSWFDPQSARIVHHGQGSSVLAYGSREGWRADGTVNWRAALRRAYGPAAETRAWRALRLNLRLRLEAKRVLGRATDRDRAALAAARAADPVPRLPADVTSASGRDRFPGV